MLLQVSEAFVLLIIPFSVQSGCNRHKARARRAGLHMFERNFARDTLLSTSRTLLRDESGNDTAHRSLVSLELSSTFVVRAPLLPAWAPAEAMLARPPKRHMPVTTGPCVSQCGALQGDDIVVFTLASLGPAFI